MKRIISMLLALALMCGCALAEDEPGFFESFGKRLDSFFSSAGERIDEALGSAGEALESAQSAMEEALESAGSAVESALQSAGDALESAYQSASEAVEGAMSSVSSFTREQYEAIREELSSWYREFSDSLKEKKEAFESDREEEALPAIRGYYLTGAKQAGLDEKTAEAQWAELTSFAEENGLDPIRVCTMGFVGLLDASKNGTAQAYSPTEWLLSHGLDDPDALEKACHEIVRSDSPTPKGDEP